MNITIKTGFSKSRIESFYKFHMKYVSPSRYVEIGLIVLCMIVGLIGIIVFNELMNTLVALLVAIVICGTYGWRVYHVVKTSFKEKPMDSRTYTINLNEKEVTFIEDGNISTYQWSDVVWVKEIDICFYIYVTKQKAIIIPKYTIKQSDKEMLIEFFQKNCNYQRYKFMSSLDEEGVV